MNRFLFAIVVLITFAVLLGYCGQSHGGVWVGGVYIPTDRGDPLYSYYTGDYGCAVGCPPPRTFNYPPRHFAPPPVAYRGHTHYPAKPRPYVNPGRHGSVHYGKVHVHW